MKKNLFLLILLASVFTAWGQIETDDLYYTAKDRQRESDSRPKINRNILRDDVDSNVDIFGDNSDFTTRKNKKNYLEFDGNYAGRTLNPDFDPYTEEGSVEEYNYFNSNYAPLGVNGNLYNRYQDPSFPSSTFYNSWNSFRNPYSSWGYNRYYDPFYSPFGNGFNSFGYNGLGNAFDPYWGSGCFSCSSMGWGSGFGGSWLSLNYSFNQFGWNNPYWGYGYNSWYRPNTVIINNYDRYPRVGYGKRPSRSTNYNNDAQQNVRTRQMIVSGAGSRSNQAGRISSDGTNQYYQRGWRQDPSINTRLNSSSGNTLRSSGWNLNSSGLSSDHASRSSSQYGNFGNSSRSSGFSGNGFSGGSGGSSSGARRGRN